MLLVGGKIALQPNYLISQSPEKVVQRNFEVDQGDCHSGLHIDNNLIFLKENGQEIEEYVKV